MSSRASAALLAVAVALAGCSGFVGSPAPGNADPATGETTTTPTRPPGQFVPGVTEEGVTGPLALAEAHADVLRNHSYTVNATWTVRLANGSLSSRTHRFSTVNGSRMLFRLRQWNAYTSVPFPAATYWQSESRAVARLVGPNGSVSYRRSPRSPGMRYGPSDWADTLYGLLGVGSFAVTDTVVLDGELLYRLESTEPFPVASVDATGANASMWLLVDDRGLIHEYRLTARDRRRGEVIRRTAHVRFTQVGSTTVERPAWVDEAANETTPPREPAG